MCVNCVKPVEARLGAVLGDGSGVNEREEVA